MEKQKEKRVEKKDILEEVKELDRRIRSKIVYEKLDDIKQWAREIAELKQKTQLLLEELGVEDADIKRLIDYATNSPEAQLSKDDIADIKDEVKDEIADSKKKLNKELVDNMSFMCAPDVKLNSMGGYYAYATTSGSTTQGSVNDSCSSTTTWVSDSKSDKIEFDLK